LGGGIAGVGHYRRVTDLCSNLPNDRLALGAVIQNSRRSSRSVPPLYAVRTRRDVQGRDQASANLGDETTAYTLERRRD
jgi:hypothetical protein